MSNAIVVNGEVMQAPMSPAESAAEIGFTALQERKAKLVHLFQLGDSLMFGIAAEVRAIGEQELYRWDTNPETHKPYRSMQEYMPYLIDELKKTAKLHKLSERQVREYLALDQVFVRGMGIAPEQIVEDGVSHYSEIREALDYDPKTGAIAAEPRPGKIGLDKAQELIEQIHNEDWRVSDTRQHLNGLREIETKSLKLMWAPTQDGKVQLVGFRVVRAGTQLGDDALTEGVTLDEAKWMDNHARAFSNLTEVQHYILHGATPEEDDDFERGEE